MVIGKRLSKEAIDFVKNYPDVVIASIDVKVATLNGEEHRKLVINPVLKEQNEKRNTR